MMRIRLIHLAIALATIAEFSGGAWSGELLSEPTMNSSTQKGAVLLKKYHYHEAIHWFDQALRENPNDISALHARAWAHLEEEKTDLAISELNRIISLKPDFELAYVTRAQAYYENNQVDLSLKDCATLLKTSKQPSLRHEIYHLRGRIYRAQKEFDKAGADFDAGLKLSPKDAGFYWNRGNVWLDAGQYQKAVDAYNQAIRFTAESDEDRLARYYSSRATAYDKLGKKDLAAADRKKINAKVSTDLDEIFNDKH